MEKTRYELEPDGTFRRDASGQRIPLSATSCWLYYKKMGVQGFSWNHNFKCTCPKAGLYQVNLSISVYKLLALLELEPDNPLVDQALSCDLEASRLCNSGPSGKSQHILRWQASSTLADEPFSNNTTGRESMQVQVAHPDAAFRIPNLTANTGRTCLEGGFHGPEKAENNSNYHCSQQRTHLLPKDVREGPDYLQCFSRPVAFD